MDPQSEQVNVSQDEKLLGLFSHLSVFFGSLIIPFTIWMINKKKSKFIKFHSLQALFFHLGLKFVNIFVGILGGITLGIYSGITKHRLNDISSLSPFQIIVIIMIAIIILLNIIVGFVLGVMNAISAYEGKLKKYPIIGNIVYKKVYGTN